MKLNDKVYDGLKWITIIVLPAIGTAYLAITKIWTAVPYGDEVVATTIIVTTFFGTILKISTSSYNKSDDKYDGVMTYDPTDEAKDLFSLNLNNLDPAEMTSKGSFLLKMETKENSQ